jgi:hypothetical protein
MTPEQQHAILEAAAKACGLECSIVEFGTLGVYRGVNEYDEIVFDPLTNPADTASMCAKLDINTYWWPEYVDCTTQNISCDIPHDGTPEGKEAAWRLAATMVAAKIGGYTE